MATERPQITQGFLNKLETPGDMPSGFPWVQYRVENFEEMARFLEDEIANKFGVPIRMVPIPGHQVLIQTAVIGADLQLSPGDCLIVHPDMGRPRLGVVRAKNSVAHREADGLRDHDNPEFMNPRDKEISH